MIERRIECSENLRAMGRIPDGSVQLVYMDPPFNSRRSYGIQVSRRGSDGRDGLRAGFDDLASWGADTEACHGVLSELLPDDSVRLIEALTGALGPSGLSAYLVGIAARLAHARRILSASGSLFLHCDPSASHYLKVIADAVLGADQFRNEVVWRRTHSHGSARRLAPVHDTILFYTRTGAYRWTDPTVPYTEDYIHKFFRHEDERGRHQLITCTAPGDRTGTRAHYRWHGQWPPPGRHWAWMTEEMDRLEAEGLIVRSRTGVPRRKVYVGEGRGVRLSDVWDDVNRLDTHSSERVGFETQKPVPLLTRIIEATTDPGDMVVDPFAGSGTAAVAAERLGRRWHVVDESLGACSLALGRVRAESPELPVALGGFPSCVDEALDLRRTAPHTYGLWATGMVATLHDRRRSDARVATGRGVSSDGARKVRSWVPLADGERAHPSASDRAKDQIHLLVGERSEERDKGFRHVTLATCVGQGARSRGYAVVA